MLEEADARVLGPHRLAVYSIKPDRAKLCTLNGEHLKLGVHAETQDKNVTNHKAGVGVAIKGVTVIVAHELLTIEEALGVTDQYVLDGLDEPKFSIEHQGNLAVLEVDHVCFVSALTVDSNQIACRANVLRVVLRSHVDFGALQSNISVLLLGTLRRRGSILELLEDYIDGLDPDLLNAVERSAACHHGRLHVIESVQLLLDEGFDLAREDADSTLARLKARHLSHVVFVPVNCPSHLGLNKLYLLLDLAKYMAQATHEGGSVLEDGSRFIREI